MKGEDRQSSGQHGRYFAGWESLQDWHETTDSDAIVLSSPVIPFPRPFDQVILSWNLHTSDQGSYEFSVQVPRGGGWSPVYVLGQWGPGAGNSARTSVAGQKDDAAKVLTDTLVLSEPAQSLRVVVRRLGGPGDVADLTFLGVSVLDSRVQLLASESDRSGWGIELAVPQLCQLDYEGGGVWCSPTSVGMVLSHWANVLRRDNLRHAVPELAAQVFDPGWGGTGNWPFNTAFAGAFSGIRAYVVRLSDVTELEGFVESGIPVTVSVAYSVLKRQPKRASDGHLIVCVGFTEEGDIIANDPARKGHVRWVYDRNDFMAAWKGSQNTAYLIYPEDWDLPSDPFGQWSFSSP